MPIPPNLTAATATQIGVGSTVTQEIDDGTTAYTVWYTFTALQSFPLVGVFALGSLTLNGSSLSVFTGPASSPTAYPPSTPIASAVNVPVQFPVVQGTTYYLELAPTNADVPASVTLSVEALPVVDAPIGSFFIPPAQAVFPGVLLSGTSSDLALNATGFPPSLPIDVLPTTGFIAATVPAASPMEVQIFSAQLTLAATANLAATFVGPTFIRQAQGVFWVGSASGSGNAARAVSVTFAGIVGATTYVFGPNTLGLLAGFAVSPTTTIIYFSGVTGSTNQPVKRWSITTNTGLSDLVAGVVGAQTGPLLCLADGTVLACYNTNPVTVLHYSAAGATLNTYTITGATGEIGGLASAIDDPNSFWIDTLGSDGVTHTLSNIQVSTGTVLSAIQYPEFANGIYLGTPTATPPSRFGADPAVGGFVVLRAIVPATVGIPTTLALRRERTVPLPVQPGNARQTVSRLEIQFQPGTGIATSPTQNPHFFAQISWDNGQTWSNERLMSAGREGAYLTRAFLNLLGAGRYPVVRIVTTDTFVPVLTDAFVWVTPGTH
jgi:hypothetical protein